MEIGLREILRHFDIEMETVPYGNGHINATYLVETRPRTILQRLPLHG